jgi:hypothetical protein
MKPIEHSGIDHFFSVSLAGDRGASPPVSRNVMLSYCEGDFRIRILDHNDKRLDHVNADDLDVLIEGDPSEIATMLELVVVALRKMTKYDPPETEGEK